MEEPNEEDGFNDSSSDEGNAASQNDLNIPQTDDLPKGWEERIDPSSKAGEGGEDYKSVGQVGTGRTTGLYVTRSNAFVYVCIVILTKILSSFPTAMQAYYYNTFTGKSEWLRPTGGAGVSSTNEEENNLWEERFDKASGFAYYFNKNTGESVWEKPTNFEAKASRHSAALVASGDGAGSASQRQRKSATGNSSVWEQRIDPGSGVTYYFNSETQVSQWEVPLDFTPGKALLPQSAAQLSNWELKTTEDGYPYYFNKKTMESVWDKPSDYDGLTESGATSSKSKWELRTTNEGYHYYFNVETSESTWERPDEFKEEEEKKEEESRCKPLPHLEFSTFGMFASVKQHHTPWLRRWIQIEFASDSKVYDFTAITSNSDANQSLPATDYEKLTVALPNFAALVKSSTKVRR